jgi:hypothetical protein
MICWFLFSRLGLELHLASMMFCWMCLGDGLQELVLFLVYGAGTVMFLRCAVLEVCVLPPLIPLTWSMARLASSCGAASTNFCMQ